MERFYRKTLILISIVVLAVIGLMLLGVLPVPFKCAASSSDRGTCVPLFGPGELRWEYIRI